VQALNIVDWLWLSVGPSVTPRSSVLRSLGEEGLPSKASQRRPLNRKIYIFKKLINFARSSGPAWPRRSRTVIRLSAVCEIALNIYLGMYYVYIIRSQQDTSHYVGSTNDLKRRLQEHNHGGAKFTSSKRPYKLVWYCAFCEKNRAIEFEKYLKQGSGFAFARNHLV